MNNKTFIKQKFSKDQLSAQEMERVLNAFEEVRFSKDEFLSSTGQVLNHYYFLEEGFIRSFVYDYNGNEITSKFYSESEIIIDWTSFMLRVPTQEYFQAITDCVCWRLSFTDFQELFNTIKGFRTSGRNRFTECYTELKNNHLSMISLTAKERYLKLLKEQADIINNAPLKHIASYLGITDTSLSRIRKEIAR